MARLGSAVLVIGLLAIAIAPPVAAQFPFGNFFNNLLRPIMTPFNRFGRALNFGIRDLFRFGPTSNSAFRAEGRDKLFPDDCGRFDDGKGKLCFGDPALCRESKQ
jgi:hypothetical protein